MEERRKKRVDWLENFKTTFLVREKKKKKKKKDKYNQLAAKWIAKYFSPICAKCSANIYCVKFVSNIRESRQELRSIRGQINSGLRGKKKNGFNILFLKD